MSDVDRGRTKNVLVIQAEIRVSGNDVAATDGSRPWTKPRKNALPITTPTLSAIPASFGAAAYVGGLAWSLPVGGSEHCDVCVFGIAFHSNGPSPVAPTVVCCWWLSYGMS
jgi:hypothetical protein